MWKPSTGWHYASSTCPSQAQPACLCHRFEAVFQEACRLAAQLGTIIKLDLAADLPMNERNKYGADGWV